MHISRLSLLAAALFTLAGASATAQTTPADAVTDSVRVTTGALHHVTAEEAVAIDMPYQLSNGQIFAIRQQDRHFFAHLAQRPNGPALREVEIYPVAAGKFVTKKGASVVFSETGERVTIDDAQYLPGLHVTDDMRLAGNASSTGMRVVSR